MTNARFSNKFIILWVEGGREEGEGGGGGATIRIISKANSRTLLSPSLCIAMQPKEQKIWVFKAKICKHVNMK
jgi:hypothetical protein